ncbi:MAG: hypothetical protein CL755_00785 [Chloroflexi bacterium]|jgi:hypothetical protein|nr:hypothetical protein [Chloroflexota bacterium]HIB12930.1 DUF3179 domain-containing protein [Dehalococcoidia bacterium]
MWLFGALAGKSGYIIAFLLIALVAAVFLLPQIRQSVLKLRSQQVTIARTPGQAGNGGDSVVSLDIITVLGKDGIPSIDNPRFVGPGEADQQMQSFERVLGVSINGDHRAYPLNMLSRHEIVNDTVGGVPVAVTW